MSNACSPGSLPITTIGHHHPVYTIHTYGRCEVPAVSHDAVTIGCSYVHWCNVIGPPVLDKTTTKSAAFHLVALQLAPIDGEHFHGTYINLFPGCCRLSPSLLLWTLQSLPPWPLLMQLVSQPMHDCSNTVALKAHL
jgi:hypothetical protein